MMYSVHDFLDGLALPPHERQGAVLNARRLLSALEADATIRVCCDLDWLAAAFRREIDWGLARTLDPQWWPRDSHRGATIIVLAMRGEDLIATSAMRWIWLDGSLKEMHESGRFFYGDYAGLVKQPAACVVTAPSAEDIKHCAVVYSCGWKNRPVQGVPSGLNSGQGGRMIRLAQLLAGINWYWSYIIGRSKPAIVRQWVEPLFGFSMRENGIYVRDAVGIREEAYHLVAARVDHMRRQFQREEYGDGEKSLADHLPLLEGMTR